jgi:hypothetical protein
MEIRLSISNILTYSYFIIKNNIIHKIANNSHFKIRTTLSSIPSSERGKRKGGLFCEAPVSLASRAGFGCGAVSAFLQRA